MSKIRLPAIKGIAKSKKINPVMNSKFKSAITKIISDFFESRQFKHALSKGVARENSVLDFFSKNLPKNYSITSGEVVDLFENTSPQMDLIIYENTKSVPLFLSQELSILPAEAVLSAIEVKSKLTKEEITKCFKSVEKLKALKPYKYELSECRNRGDPADEKSRYFYSIFAYESDLSEKNWMKNEYHRVINVAKELGLNPHLIDRVYVYNKGIINIKAKGGYSEIDSKGSAFMNFYLEILAFLLRENSRRPYVPYSDYAGSTKDTFRKIE